MFACLIIRIIHFRRYCVPELVLGPVVKEETLPGRREQVPPPQPTPQWGGMLRGHRPTGTGG